MRSTIVAVSVASWSKRRKVSGEGVSVMQSLTVEIRITYLKVLAQKDLREFLESVVQTLCTFEPDL